MLYYEHTHVNKKSLNTKLLIKIQSLSDMSHQPFADITEDGFSCEKNSTML